MTIGQTRLLTKQPVERPCRRSICLPREIGTRFTFTVAVMVLCPVIGRRFWTSPTGICSANRPENGNAFFSTVRNGWLLANNHPSRCQTSIPIIGPGSANGTGNGTCSSHRIITSATDRMHCRYVRRQASKSGKSRVVGSVQSQLGFQNYEEVFGNLKIWVASLPWRTV